MQTMTLLYKLKHSADKFSTIFPLYTALYLLSLITAAIFCAVEWSNEQKSTFQCQREGSKEEELLASFTAAMKHIILNIYQEEHLRGKGDILPENANDEGQYGRETQYIKNPTMKCFREFNAKDQLEEQINTCSLTEEL